MTDKGIGTLTQLLSLTLNERTKITWDTIRTLSLLVELHLETPIPNSDLSDLSRLTALADFRGYSGDDEGSSLSHLPPPFSP